MTTQSEAFERTGTPDEEMSQQRAVADDYGMPFIDLSETEPDPLVLKRFPARKLFEFEMLPLTVRGDVAEIATAEPMALKQFSQLACYSGLRIEPVLACQSAIQRLLREHLGVGGGAVAELARNDESADLLNLDESDGDLDDDQASFVVQLVNELLVEAIAQHASDVHVEPEGETLEVRFRVDGILRPQPVPPEIHRFRLAIVSRLKIMAKLNIAEKRLPQDGRCQINLTGQPVDLRVSVIPMLEGEGLVLRLLDRSGVSFDLDSIEFASELRDRWGRLIQRPNGLLLVTGPTGSGKTTTLYSSLMHIRSPSTKIITVEDPVEYQLRGISQIQVHSRIGLDFAAGLRSILRHDPDVILLGEIRDEETARSAVQASLTGHLVLSTLHTNDAASAVSRLLDMGIEEYLLAGTLQAVLAQRLLRRICSHCSVPFVPSVSELPKGFPVHSGISLSRGQGCPRCYQTGYSGRVPVFELLEFHGRTLTATDKYCRTTDDGSLQSADLLQSGWDRVLQGMTTLEEVNRVLCTD